MAHCIILLEAVLLKVVSAARHHREQCCWSADLPWPSSGPQAHCVLSGQRMDAVIRAGPTPGLHSSAGPHLQAVCWFSSVLLHLSQFRETLCTDSRKGRWWDTLDDAFIAHYSVEKTDLWQRAATGCEHSCSCSAWLWGAVEGYCSDFGCTSAFIFGCGDEAICAFFTCRGSSQTRRTSGIMRL